MEIVYVNSSSMLFMPEQHGHLVGKQTKAFVHFRMFLSETIAVCPPKTTPPDTITWTSVISDVLMIIIDITNRSPIEQYVIIVTLKGKYVTFVCTEFRDKQDSSQ